MALQDQYRELVQLERQRTSSRYTTFASFLSVSFVVPGLAALAKEKTVHLPLFGDTPASSLIVLLGSSFFAFAALYYWWHHRVAHRYRRRLKAMERRLGIKIYRLRTQPRVLGYWPRFAHSLWAIAAAYALMVMLYVGFWLFLTWTGTMLALYVIMTLIWGRRPH